MARIFIPPLLTLMVGLGLNLHTFEEESSPNKPFSYPEHLTGAFTGGFEEETCRSCHFDYPLNFEKASLKTEGFPDEYVPGQTYRLKIIVDRPGLKKAGFQLTARFGDGSQAGTFRLPSDSLQFTESTPDSIQYVQHSPKGTMLPDTTRAKWTIEWAAPDKTDKIWFHLAANAANGDASEFGDYIMSLEILLTSQRESKY